MHVLELFSRHRFLAPKIDRHDDDEAAGHDGRSAALFMPYIYLLTVHWTQCVREQFWSYVRSGPTLFGGHIARRVDIKLFVCARPLIFFGRSNVQSSARLCSRRWPFQQKALEAAALSKD